MNGQTNRETDSYANQLPNRKKETPTDTEARMQIYRNKKDLQLTMVLWNFVLLWENYGTMEKNMVLWKTKKKTMVLWKKP